MSKLTLAIILFFLVLLITLFLIWPKYQELKNLEVQIQRKKAEIQYLEEYFSKIKGDYQKLEDYKIQLSKIDSAFPSDSSLTLISLMDFLQETNTQNGLFFETIQSFSITLAKSSVEASSASKSQPISKKKEIALGFESSGPYSAFKNFLDVLEKSAKLIEVERVSFSFEEGNFFSFDFKIKTYSY